MAPAAAGLAAARADTAQSAVMLRCPRGFEVRPVAAVDRGDGRSGRRVEGQGFDAEVPQGGTLRDLGIRRWASRRFGVLLALL